MGGAGALLDLSGGPVGDDPAPMHQHGAPGELFGLFQVVGGEEHRGPSVGLAAHPVPELVAGAGVHPCGGLIQNHQIRAGQQRQGEAQPLLLAAGALSHRAVSDLEDAGGLHDLAHRQRVPVQGSDDLDGLLDREVGQEAAGLQQRPDAPGTDRVARCAAEDADLTPVGGVEPQDHVHEGGLACAVGAEDCGDLSRGEVQGDAVHGVDGAAGAVGIAAPEITDADDGFLCCAHASSIRRGTRGHVEQLSRILHDICHGAG